jgi:hypothetical protein
MPADPHQDPNLIRELQRIANQQAQSGLSGPGQVPNLAAQQVTSTDVQVLWAPSAETPAGWLQTWEDVKVEMTPVFLILHQKGVEGVTMISPHAVRWVRVYAHGSELHTP